jgi:hypothetical protein
MNIRSCLQKSYTQLDPDRANSHIKELVKHDRYQASAGICATTEYLKKYFLTLNNVRLTVHNFTTKNSGWWTFDSPLSWTPLSAKVDFYVDKKLLYQINHELQPCSVATNSKDWSKDQCLSKIVVYDPEHIQGLTFYKDALVIIKKANHSFSEIINLIEQAGASGFITDYFYKKINSEDLIGRIELSKTANLFGFSSSPYIVDGIIENLDKDCFAEVDIQIDQSHSMPVVDAFLDLGNQNEIWIVAHLCHQRPGANDNASGIAGILELAGALAKKYENLSNGFYSIRFLLGPEFTGMAAYLHEIIAKEERPLPKFVINMDMIAENLELCESKFYIERPPLSMVSFHQCLLEKIAQELKDFLYLKGEEWSFNISGFLGYSDHALFADAHFKVPATQLCHFPDVYNHTSGDSLEKVDALQLQKVMTIVLTLITNLCELSENNIEELRNIIIEWCSKEFIRINTVNFSSGVDFSYLEYSFNSILSEINILPNKLKNRLLRNLKPHDNKDNNST